MSEGGTELGESDLRARKGEGVREREDGERVIVHNSGFYGHPVSPYAGIFFTIKEKSQEFLY